MKKLLIATIIVVAISFTYLDLSFAVCVEGPADTFTCNTNPPNPDLNGVQSDTINDVTVNILAGAEINTQGQPGNLDAVQTTNGNDNITITGGTLRAEASGVQSGNQSDNITVIDSLVSSLERAIESGNQDDVVMVTGSVVTSLSNDGIETANQSDQVTIIDSVITGGGGFFAVDTGNQDDTITLGTGAVLNGGIDCGSQFDTLIFAMDVPEEALLFLSSELAAANPAGDSITINEIFYEWINCEVIVNQLVGVRVVRPVPTLSEWGLIAMAGILGIAGLLYVARRKGISAA